jgi:hypothetical protein
LYFRICSHLAAQSSNNIKAQIRYLQSINVKEVSVQLFCVIEVLGSHLWFQAIQKPVADWFPDSLLRHGLHVLLHGLRLGCLTF